jgi:hypothetical protein
MWLGRDQTQQPTQMRRPPAILTEHPDQPGRSILSSARWRDRAECAARVLKSFQMTFEPEGKISFGINVDAIEGFADSGDLGEDLTDVLVALGEAALEYGAGVLFLFDEVQFLSSAEFEALIAALHKTVQRRLPIIFTGAGLPQLPRLAGDAKSYAERLFRFPAIGRLPRDEAAQALVTPAERLDVTYEPDAVEAIIEYTEGTRISCRSTESWCGTARRGHRSHAAMSPMHERR